MNGVVYTQTTSQYRTEVRPTISKPTPVGVSEQAALEAYQTGQVSFSVDPRGFNFQLVLSHIAGLGLAEGFEPENERVWDHIHVGEKLVVRLCLVGVWLMRESDLAVRQTTADQYLRIDRLDDNLAQGQPTTAAERAFIEAAKCDVSRG
jgi:hypothetical protein